LLSSANQSDGSQPQSGQTGRFGDRCVDDQVVIVGEVGIPAHGISPNAQAVQVLENIRAILVANKADMKDVVQVTVYVTDMRAFHDIADIRMNYFPKDGPTSVIVEVSKLALPELQIEISAIAAV